MSKRGLFVFPAAASLVNFAFGRGASMHCRGLLKGRSKRRLGATSRRCLAAMACRGKSKSFNLVQHLARREIIGHRGLCGNNDISRRGESISVALDGASTAATHWLISTQIAAFAAAHASFAFSMSSNKALADSYARCAAAFSAARCRRTSSFHSLNARWNLLRAPQHLQPRADVQSSLEALARRYGIKRLRLAELC